VAADTGPATVPATINTRTIRPNARAFPTGQKVGTPPRGGLADPEVRGEPDGEANAAAAAPRAASKNVTHRSASPRPDPSKAQAAAAASGIPVPNVVGSAVQTGGARINKTFTGLDFVDQRFANNGNQFSVEPPDQGLCVGNGFVLETVNTVLQVFNTNGAALAPPTDLNTFYGYPAQIDRTTGVEGPFVTDPSCLYDAATQRWFHVVLTAAVDPDTGDFLGPNHIDLAVSKTSSPLGAWNLYVLPVQDDGTQGTPKHPNCPCIGDFPHIGADAHGIYVTTNEYPFDESAPGKFGNNFNGAQLYAFQKDRLVAGLSTKVLNFQGLSSKNGTKVVPGFGVWPAQTNGTGFSTGANGTEFFLSSTAGEEALGTGMSNNIVLWGLSNTNSLSTNTPSLTLVSKTMTSEAYGVPPASEQKLGKVPLRDCLVTECLDGLGPAPGEVEGHLDSSDSRMFQPWYRGGLLYATLGTVMNLNGEIHAGAAWFEVNTGGSGSIAAQGYIGVTNNNVIYPSIAVLPSGFGAVAFTLVGRDYFPSAAELNFTNTPSGALHITGAGAGPQDGFTEYKFLSDPFPLQPRWGDYGAAVTDGTNLWVASEWIAQTCSINKFSQDPTCGGTRGTLGNWSTRIARIS
jgi:hypothetical protein